MKNDCLLFENAFIHSSIGMALVSPEGKWLDANPALCQIVGFSKEEMLASDFQKLTHPEDLDRDLGLVQECLEFKRKSYQMEKRYYHKNGDLVWAKLTVSAIIEEGKVQFFLSQIQDITEAKIAQQRLVDASKMAALGEMAAGIAHEINNPLTVIEGNASILKAKLEGMPLEGDSLDRLDKIGKTVQRISSIINGMRNFARKSEHKKLCNHSLRQILQETLNICHQKLVSARIATHMDFEGDMPVFCDGVELGQVFLNLICNAVHAMEGAKEKTLRISVREEHGIAQVDFQDNGEGVAQSIRGEIMKPFFTTKPRGKGTGLGLSLSKEMLDRMGGEIKLLDSESGATFRVSLACAAKRSAKAA